MYKLGIVDSDGVVVDAIEFDSIDAFRTKPKIRNLLVLELSESGAVAERADAEAEDKVEFRRRALRLERENNRIIAARKAEAEALEARRERTRHTDDELDSPTRQRDINRRDR